MTSATKPEGSAKQFYESLNGLDDVVVAATKVSHVFGEEGRLIYSGYEINQLASQATYEEVCHLLWKGHLPNAAELDALNRALR